MRANPNKISQNYQELLKTEFESKVTKRAYKIGELIDSIDLNNTGILHDINECR